MSVDDSKEGIKAPSAESLPPLKLRKPKQIKFPRRTPSVVEPPREIVYVTADKTTCARCDCYNPRDSPYVKPPKLDPCRHTPVSLYELTAEVVDKLPLPEAFKWSVEDVARWMCDDVGLPRYKKCIEDNFIDGMRLLMLEDPSKPPLINIRDYNHILMVTSKVRELYSTDLISFARSIGLPPRRPGVHCTWFKSRTGPSWGIRQNWTRYLKLNFPNTKFARIKERVLDSEQRIPHYMRPDDRCDEYTTPRRFRLLNLPEDCQLIWMERRPPEEKRPKRRREKRRKKDSTLIPKPVDASGLTGKEFILARRLMPRRKFFS